MKIEAFNNPWQRISSTGKGFSGSFPYEAIVTE
jgi:hypothetical protein